MTGCAPTHASEAATALHPRWAPLLEPHGRLSPQTINEMHTMRSLAVDDPAVPRPRRPNP
eukprot:scaffold98213_cov52-Phaeocystis_antarctica.AAC.4